MYLERRPAASICLLCLLASLLHTGRAAWSSDLGVVQLPKMFAIAPLAQAEPKRSATVVMQAWARRVGGQDVAFGLPHQQQVRGGS